MFEIKYDGSKAIRGLSLLARSVGMNARVAYYELMRLWINDLIKRTPPRTTKQGKDAIEGDLNKLFVGVDKRPVMEFLADDFKGSEPQGTIINDAGNVGRMRSYHEKHRNSQGRVRRREVKTKLGGINFVNKMYVPGSVLRKYKKTRKSHVGTLKAGWLNAANYYARKSGGRVIAPPWVKKQARRLGSKVDAMRPSGSGFIESNNKVPFAAGHKGLQRWVKWTESARLRDIRGGFFEKRFKRDIEKFNRIPA